MFSPSGSHGLSKFPWALGLDLDLLVPEVQCRSCWLLHVCQRLKMDIVALRYLLKLGFEANCAIKRKRPAGALS